MIKIKYCPDLTGYKTEKAVMIGTGDYTRPVLHECLKEKCVAYSGKTCIKYASCTEYEETEDEDC